MATEYNNPDLRKQLYYEALRKEAHSISGAELKERLEKNPIPTDSEIVIGAYFEEIEPQVRAVVRIMNAKGYATESSGFWGSPEKMIQQVDGFFEVELDDETKHKLLNLGCEIKSDPNSWNYIRFTVAEGDDLRKIESKWLKIAEILPDLGHPGFYSRSGGSDDFRAKIPDQKRVEKVLLERQLASGNYHPSYEERLRSRLKELNE